MQLRKRATGERIRRKALVGSGVGEYTTAIVGAGRAEDPLVAASRATGTDV
jgi:hypothetical protein